MKYGILNIFAIWRGKKEEYPPLAITKLGLLTIKKIKTLAKPNNNWNIKMKFFIQFLTLKDRLNPLIGINKLFIFSKDIFFDSIPYFDPILYMLLFFNFLLKVS